MEKTIKFSSSIARNLIIKAPAIVEENTIKYGFDLNKLKPGDVLLTFGNNRAAQIIAGGTSGLFSHALIYLGNTSVHAMPKSGVYTKNPQRLIFNHQSHLTALRPKNSFSLKMMRNYAMSWVGGLYSAPEAIGGKLFAKSKIESITETQYCSRLVAQACLAGGIKLVKNPDYCSPNDLHRSNELEEVPNAVIELSDQQIDFAKSRDYNEIVLHETMKWLSKVRYLLKNKNIPINKILDIHDFLLKNNEFDDVICKIIKETKYINYVSIDKEINPWRYNKKLFIDYVTENAIDLDKACIRELNIVIDEINNRIYNISEESKNGKDLEYVRINQSIQKQLLSNARERNRVILEILYG